MSEALSMGWMAMAILAGLLVYFQVTISDPAAKKRAVFKTFIGIVSTFLLFVAIAKYKTNFYGESRLLPVSLVMAMPVIQASRKTPSLPRSMRRTFKSSCTISRAPHATMP